MGFYSEKLDEESLKIKVAKDWFPKFNYDTPKRIDFRISYPNELPGLEIESLLWAEAKRSTQSSIIESFVQLILTIGKGKLQDSELPPAYLGAFDSEKIAFIPYNSIMEVFDPSRDFNWNVTPSNHSTREFVYLYDTVGKIINNNKFTFYFDNDANDLRSFLKHGFSPDKAGKSKIQINKNNFVNVYFKWLKAVPHSINVHWASVKNAGIIEADFYLADLLSANGKTLVENLFVILDNDKYIIDRKIVEGMLESKQATFNDNQRAYSDFWNRYERPPKEEYWEYIQSRRDLLVPPDIRETEGSFFTPQIWVEKSQEYLASVLGENWQDEYYIWDCCAGTGNMEAGLIKADNIWASTLERGDVAIMHERVRNGANLYINHIFQFDFLNDSFEKLPNDLKAILNDPEKRKKLVLYINPPYKESSDAKQISGTGKNKDKVATKTKVYADSQKTIGTAARELFAQFLYRIYKEIPDCKIAHFSKLKILQAPNFTKFNGFFKAHLHKLFIVPANTFDNVQGQFPIGFYIWDTSIKEIFNIIHADVYDAKGFQLGAKKIERRDAYMVEWLRGFYDKNNPAIGYLRLLGSDMQHNKDIFITLKPSANDFQYKLIHEITKNNLIYMAMYNTIRHCVDATWLNDREQFLFPNDGWESDVEFQLDCLAFTLFDNSNNVKSTDGINHWIPFTAKEVGSKNGFSSNFMTDYFQNRRKESDRELYLFDVLSSGHVKDDLPLKFSIEAKTVFDAGREVWKYYHSKPNANPNASLYDIREFFQGRDGTGRMNNTSNDSEYMRLIENLRKSLKDLAQKIEPKVYEYGFLLR
jgi:hypothetical protein